MKSGVKPRDDGDDNTLLKFTVISMNVFGI